MFKKLILSAATAATLVLGTGIMTAAPAAAQVHFGFGIGDGYGYNPGYYPAYGWHHRRRNWAGGPPVRCFIKTVRWHHHWVNRRVCRPAYY